MNTERTLTNPRLPLLITALLAALLLLLIAFGSWRSSSAAAQVQVPMFYDAHYLFPRPWTQEQAAPGIPGDAPLAFDQSNRISQSFISGSDNLAMIELALDGPPQTAVTVSLSGADGTRLGTEIPLVGRGKRSYYLGFPSQPASQGQRYTLTISAPQADHTSPAVTWMSGGDRLAGSFKINEFNRPGNLALKTYARGAPGTWWLQSVGEQLLPAIFRLRLQQYKITPFKGAAFAVLLLSTAGLSLLFLILSRPQRRPSAAALSRAVGWSLVLILSLFLLWQMAGARLLLPGITPVSTLNPITEPLALSPPVDGRPRLVADLTADLWTAKREPEARFVHTSLVDGFPAVQVPAISRLAYPLVVPPDGRLQLGFAAAGQGAIEAQIRLGADIIYQEQVPARNQPQAGADRWLSFDLAPWAGQAAALELITTGSAGKVQGYWLWPRLVTTAPWLLADPPPPELALASAGFVFDETVALLGYQGPPQPARAGETAVITLFWRPLAPVEENGTIFLHLLDSQGQLVAQHDAQPLGGAYPMSAWQPGTIIQDAHPLALPPDLPPGNYTLAAGIYDPQSLGRWTVKDAGGSPVPEYRALLLEPLEVAP